MLVEDWLDKPLLKCIDMEFRYFRVMEKHWLTEPTSGELK